MRLKNEKLIYFNDKTIVIFVYFNHGGRCEVTPDRFDCIKAALGPINIALSARTEPVLACSSPELAQFWNLRQCL